LLTFTSDGIDVGNDLDRDILTAGVEWIRVDGLGGNDRIDASAYSSQPPGTSVGVIELYGGSGNDVLIGSSILVNYLYGEEDADTMYGGAANDALYGGPGDDRMFGRDGNDSFYTE